MSNIVSPFTAMLFKVMISVYSMLPVASAIHYPLRVSRSCASYAKGYACMSYTFKVGKERFMPSFYYSHAYNQGASYLCTIQVLE